MQAGAVEPVEQGVPRGPLRHPMAGWAGAGRPGRAADAGELAPGTDPAQLAFELSAILAGTNIVAVLHDDDAAIDRARRAVTARLAG
jgi:hypothetical protein